MRICGLLDRNRFFYSTLNHFNFYKRSMTLDTKLTGGCLCGSGKTISSYFCPDCGSVIYNELAVAPDFQFMKVGTLDDHTWFKPSLAVYCDSAQAWVNLGDDIDQSA